MKTFRACDFVAASDGLSGALIDVRERDEFAHEHIPGAVNYPLSELTRGRWPDLPGSTPLYVICQSGGRSLQACRLLENQGFTHVTNLDGGLSNYKRQEGNLVRESRVLPLMRQVQIAAGFLVLTGVVLAKALHPGFMYLSGFVGAGLIFAGISGICPMANILAKLPWNKPCGTSCCQE